MNNHAVSVVMSVYNGERFLRQAVESILDQSFRDFEFIIIDDGSTDGSAAILESFQAADARVRVYQQENRGLVESLNRGCRLARGKYIARMDADDIAVKDRLAWQVEFMEEHPELSVLGGAVERIDQEGRHLGIHRSPATDQAIRWALLYGNVFWHPTVLFRKEDFFTVGGYRNILAAEDYDLWLRIVDRFQSANLAAVLVRYRIHSDQVTVTKSRQQALSALASRAGALSRRNGSSDPLDSVGEITAMALVRLAAEIMPAVLDRRHVSKATQPTTLVRPYLRWIRDSSDVPESSDFVKAAINTLQSCDYRHAGRWVIAEVELTVAYLYWKQARFATSLLVAGHAIMTRPLILARVLRQLRRGYGLTECQNG